VEDDPRDLAEFERQFATDAASDLAAALYFGEGR
jgi:hypothetical protein